MDYEVGHETGKGFQGKGSMEEKVERINTELKKIPNCSGPIGGVKHD